MRKYMKEVVVALMSQPTIFTPTTITANSLNLSRPALLRPPPTLASRSIITMINDQEQQHQLLDAIFKQKKVLRSRVRKQLKAMDPTIRSQEGKLSLLPSNTSFFGPIW